MKYKKGTFVIVPNLNILAEKPTELQTVFLWLCSYADEEGVCFPSRSALSKKCGVTIKTIDKYIAQLIELELIEKTIRRKKGTKENTSNLYQICVPDTLPSVTKDPTPSVPNDPVTIPNINNTNLTIDIQPEVVENTVTLPKMKLDGSSSGKSAVDRLLYLYSKLYYKTYEATYKPNYGRDKKIIADVLTMYSEVQTAYLLCIYFNWHGMTGNSSNDYNFVTGATFPIPMFKTMINKFEVYARNIMLSPFDDDSKLLDEVIKIVSQ